MKKILWLLTFATFFSSMAIEFIVPFYAVFLGSIGGGLIMAGATWAVYRFGSAILLIISGRLADKYDESIFLVAGFALRIIGTAGYLFVSQPIHLLSVQIIQGLAQGLIIPSYRKIYSNNLDGDKKATEWSYPQAGRQLSMGIAVFTGGFIASKFGFKVLFTIMLISHIVSFIFSIYARKEFCKATPSSTN